MELTDAQKTAIKEWVESGAELGEIQSRLKEEFELSVTYLDTRFLLADLGLELLSEQEEEEEPEEPEEPEETGEPETDAGASDGEPEAPSDASEGEAEETAPAGGVSVSVDTVAQPNALVSGRVNFSDGESAAWSLDQMGRLGLDPSKEDYQPSEADIAAFQIELQNVLRQSGF